MTIKCLSFDLDGTLLLDESKRMDPRTVNSIQRAMAQGMHVVIASGRDKNGCKFVYEPLGLENGNHFLALVNGQIIYDFENKEYNFNISRPVPCNFLYIKGGTLNMNVSSGSILAGLNNSTDKPIIHVENTTGKWND